MQKHERAVIFYLLAHPAETAYLAVQHHELSNAVWLIEIRRRKVAIHTCWGWSQAGCSVGLFAGIIESHNSALSRFNWRKVWNGVKCNFSLAHHHVQKIVGKLSIRRVRMCNFTRIGHKTKKVMAFENFGNKAVWAARLGTTPKRCELQLFFAGITQAVRRFKALNLGHLNM